MKLKQLIISIFFLFVYALSFAHSLMPHVNGFHSEHFPEVRTENENHHEHQHQFCEIPTENCITHNDHCDTGIIDLLVCVFSDSHYHHSNECDHQLVEQIHFKSITTNQFDNSNFNCFIINHSYKTYVFKGHLNQNDFHPKKYLQSFYTSQSRRGPPILS